MAKTKATTPSDLKVLEQKWSPELIEAGWTVLPAALIEHQRALGIDAIDEDFTGRAHAGGLSGKRGGGPSPGPPLPARARRPLA